MLTIQMPDQTPAHRARCRSPAPAASDADKAQMAQAMAMMKMMMRGLFVDVVLNVNGRILKSNAPYVEGSRVTLLQIDFDKLLADDAALLKLQSAKDVKSLCERARVEGRRRADGDDRVQPLRRAVTMRAHSASSGPRSTGLPALLYQ